MMTLLPKHQKPRGSSFIILWISHLEENTAKPDVFWETPADDTVWFPGEGECPGGGGGEGQHQPGCGHREVQPALGHLLGPARCPLSASSPHPGNGCGKSNTKGEGGISSLFCPVLFKRDVITLLLVISRQSWKNTVHQTVNMSLLHDLCCHNWRLTVSRFQLWSAASCHSPTRLC